MKSAANAMSYERTGTVKSKKNNVDYSYMKEIPTHRLWFGTLSNTYSRHSTFLWSVACVLTWVLLIWHRMA
jgi:hypothetical protein